MAELPEFSEMLRCPDNGEVLRPVGDAKLIELNDAVRAGELKKTDGSPVERTLEGGLVREDDAVVYPIRDGVVMLLPGEGIAVPGD